jgi:hypothetical protein
MKVLVFYTQNSNFKLEMIKSLKVTFVTLLTLSVAATTALASPYKSNGKDFECNTVISNSRPDPVNGTSIWQIHPAPGEVMDTRVYSANTAVIRGNIIPGAVVQGTVSLSTVYSRELNPRYPLRLQQLDLNLIKWATKQKLKITSSYNVDSQYFNATISGKSISNLNFSQSGVQWVKGSKFAPVSGSFYLPLELSPQNNQSVFLQVTCLAAAGPR